MTFSHLVQPAPNLAPKMRRKPPQIAAGIETPLAVAKESEERADRHPPPMAASTYSACQRKRALIHHCTEPMRLT